MESTFNHHSWGSKLDGRENQDIRYLIHCCRRTIVAIGECPHPLLEEIVPLASEHLSIRSALLALSARVRVSSRDHEWSSHPTEVPHAHCSSRCEALDRHQETITKVRSTLARLQSGSINVNYGDVMEILGSCLLLVLFGFPDQIHNWSMHVVGMIAFIESLDMELFRSVPLIRNAQATVAYLDILAFSLNRPNSSQHKWLEWGICPLGRQDGNCFAQTDTKDEFTPFEVTSGYPESLITVIALVSAVVEDIDGAGTVVDNSVACYIQDIHRKIHESEGPELMNYLDYSSSQGTPGVYWASRMHAIIAWWEPPAIPSHISIPLSLALTTAWEIIRKAVHIYVFRGGFANSIHTPRTPNQQRTTRKFVREMIVGLQSLISLAEEQEVTIANAMIWPMTVIGNEIFDDKSLQTEFVTLFQRLQRYFRIAHFSQIFELLTELWQRFTHSTTISTPAEPLPDLSLQMIASEKNLSIPLF